MTMRRMVLSDGTGRWFSPAAAQTWHEPTAAGERGAQVGAVGRSPWHRGTLYYTRRGAYVLATRLLGAGPRDQRPVVRLLPEAEAHRWLISCGYSAPAAASSPVGGPAPTGPAPSRRRRAE
jgi:hypothetical protein